MSSDSCCESESPNYIQEPFIHYNVSTSCTDFSSETSSSCTNYKKFNHPDICTFRTLITPLSALTPDNAKVPGPIQFTMRRKNKVVSLQWEPFNGTMAATGVSSLMVLQTIANLPPYPVYGVYTLVYNGVQRQAAVFVDPTNVKAQVLFNLNADGSSTGITLGDTVNVKGGLLSWIVK